MVPKDEHGGVNPFYLVYGVQIRIDETEKTSPYLEKAIGFNFLPGIAGSIFGNDEHLPVRLAEKSFRIDSHRA